MVVVAAGALVEDWAWSYIVRVAVAGVVAPVVTVGAVVEVAVGVAVVVVAVVVALENRAFPHTDRLWCIPVVWVVLRRAVLGHCSNRAE